MYPSILLLYWVHCARDVVFSPSIARSDQSAGGQWSAPDQDHLQAPVALHWRMGISWDTMRNVWEMMRKYEKLWEYGIYMDIKKYLGIWEYDGNMIGIWLEYDGNMMGIWWAYDGNIEITHSQYHMGYTNHGMGYAGNIIDMGIWWDIIYHGQIV